MAGIFEVNDLEARKRALADESDMYRQVVRLELHNLELYARRVQRKVTIFATIKPLLALGAPLAGSLFGRRQTKWMRLAEAAFAGWQLFRKFTPFVRQGQSTSAGTNAIAPRQPTD